MSQAFSLYISGTSCIHRCDARVKLLALVLLSITVFIVKTWWGIACVAAAVLVALLIARLPLARLLKLSFPLVILLLFVWVCNAFTFEISNTPQASGEFAGFMAGWEPRALWGNFGFNPQGCMTALAYLVRILIIFFSTYVISFTTTAEALTDACSSLLSFLRRFKVPVDDIATIFVLALRFIPLMAAEALQIQNAQKSRGAQFDKGGLIVRVFSRRVILVPLVVGMFRRAAMVGQAMDARCYGAAKRTSLAKRSLPAGQIAFLVSVVVCCVVVIAFL